ncbi:hypothetical protein ACFL23_02575 [Patescibacteria group bacterium]
MNLKIKYIEKIKETEMKSQNGRLTTEQLETCIKRSRQKCNQEFVGMTQVLIGESNGKSTREINDIFNSSQYALSKTTSSLILKLGVMLSNCVTGELGQAIESIYTVGSVSGGYCNNDKQKRIVFDYLSDDNNSLHGLKITPTGMVMPDLDLEILCNGDPESVKSVILTFLKKNSKGDFAEIPIDIRIISKDDVDFYLNLFQQPSYLVFRLLFGPPLCLYGDEQFSKLLEKAKKQALKRKGLSDFPEWRMWLAYMDEVRLIKGGKYDRETFFSTEELKSMGDLHWFYSLRINNTDVKNSSNFPSCNESHSIKLKFGYK